MKAIRFFPWRSFSLLSAILFLAFVSPMAAIPVAFGLTTTRTQIPNEVDVFYNRVLLTRALPLNLHALFGQRGNIDRKSGTATCKWRRYGILSAVSTPLAEGTTPGGSQLSVTDITQVVSQYGDFVTITDVIDDQSIDPVVTSVVDELLGDQMGQTNDELSRDILAAGTTIQRVNGRATRVEIISTDIMVVAECKKAVRTLGINNAKRITAISGVNPGIGSVPIDACYAGICHPKVEYDISGDNAFVGVEKYAVNTTLLPGEFGKLGNIRWCSTTNAKIFTGEGAGGVVDVYANLIFGANAYGIVDLGNSQASGVIVKAFGSGGTTDPLNQRATVGWKEYFATKILNQAFMIRIESAATA
jgi:N4-gp56 family major capsid protein